MRTLYAITASTLLATTAGAQVYRCEHGGEVTYSDEPCFGAKIVDATPTQGMNKMSGQTRKGADVLRDENRKAMDKALQPLSGLDHDQMNVERKRHKLSAGDKASCLNLDRQLPELQARVARLATSQKQEAETDLYKARKTFFALKC